MYVSRKDSRPFGVEKYRLRREFESLQESEKKRDTVEGTSTGS